MTDIFTDILDGISTKGDIPHRAPVQPVTENRPTYPCTACRGSGKYQGVRLHQTASECFKCRGKGYFFASAETRQKNRAQAADRKETLTRETLADFDTTHAGLRAFLTSAGTWSIFAASLSAALQKYGDLTPAQLQAAQSMKAKAEERATAKTAPAAVPTLERLAAAFLTSGQHLQHPKLRLMTPDGQRVVLSRAGEASRNAGSINLTDGAPYGSNTFYGTITPQGVATYRANTPPSVSALLSRFNADPQASIKAQGQMTGECCCCGRELTDPESIANGIGPICAANWGF